jgi:peptidylprolyl isomerase
MGPSAAVNAVYYNKIQEVPEGPERDAFVQRLRDEYRADVDLVQAGERDGHRRPSFTAMPFLAEAPVRSFAEAPAMMLSPTRRYRAVMETDAGRLVLNLYSAETPITCNSFVWLARNRFFEGIAFHRVIDGFVVQGGDPGTVDGPRSTWGRGGPGYRFGLEIVDDLRFDAAGVVGMARSSDPNSNGSQFYITLAPTPSLDGQYTVFGRLADADSVAVLARVVRGQPPTEPTRITRVTIEEAPR